MSRNNIVQNSNHASEQSRHQTLNSGGQHGGQHGSLDNNRDQQSSIENNDVVLGQSNSFVDDLDYSDDLNYDDDNGENEFEDIRTLGRQQRIKQRNEISSDDIEEKKSANDDSSGVRTIVIKNTPEEFARFGVKNVPKEFFTHLKEQQRNSKSILSGGGEHSHSHTHNHNEDNNIQRQQKSSDNTADNDYFDDFVPDSYVVNNGVASSSVFFDPQINNVYSDDGVGNTVGADNSETDAAAAYQSAKNKDTTAQQSQGSGQDVSNYYTEQDNSLHFKNENNIAPPFAFNNNNNNVVSGNTNDIASGNNYQEPISDYASTNVISSGGSNEPIGQSVNNVVANNVESNRAPSQVNVNSNNNIPSVQSNQASNGYDSLKSSLNNGGQIRIIDNSISAPLATAPISQNYGSPASSGGQVVSSNAVSSSNSNQEDYSSPLSDPISGPTYNSAVNNQAPTVAPNNGVPTGINNAVSTSVNNGVSSAVNNDYSSPVSDPIGPNYSAAPANTKPASQTTADFLVGTVAQSATRIYTTQNWSFW